MPLITIIEASRKFNIGRTAIYKAIKNGKLTPQLNNDGVQVLDPQDIVRIFGNSKSKTVTMNGTHTVLENNEEQIKELREQIKELKQDKEFLRHEISSIRKDFDDYKLAITYKETDTSTVLETALETKKISLQEQEKQYQVQPEIELSKVGLAKIILKKLLRN